MPETDDVIIERLSKRLSEYMLRCDTEALADLGVLCFGETDSDVQSVREISEEL